MECWVLLQPQYLLSFLPLPARKYAVDTTGEGTEKGATINGGPTRHCVWYFVYLISFDADGTLVVGIGYCILQGRKLQPGEVK